MVGLQIHFSAPDRPTAETPPGSGVISGNPSHWTGPVRGFFEIDPGFKFLETVVPKSVRVVSNGSFLRTQS